MKNKNFIYDRMSIFHKGEKIKEFYDTNEPLHQYLLSNGIIIKEHKLVGRLYYVTSTDITQSLYTEVDIVFLDRIISKKYLRKITLFNLIFENN